MDHALQDLAFNTKKICLCTFTSILIVVLFVISPLNKYSKTSILMKLIAGGILVYAIYLSYLQSNVLKNNVNSGTVEMTSQVNMNVNCNYVFIVFLCMLLFFLFKSFFSHNATLNKTLL